MYEIEQEREKLKIEAERLAEERKKLIEEMSEAGCEHKLFVGNLSPATTDLEVRQLLEPYGMIKEIVMLRDKSGLSKRSCFAKFFLRPHADAAIGALNGKVNDKSEPRPIVLRYANPKPTDDMSGFITSGGGMGGGGGMPGPAPGMSLSGGMGGPNPFAPQMMGGMGGMGGPKLFPRGPVNANLYVNNIDFNTTEQQVRTTFGTFGNILSVKLFKGYGFVSFDNAQGAQAATQSMNGMITGSGRRLEVSLKTDRNPARARAAPY